jgi:hypothetical protein
MKHVTSAGATALIVMGLLASVADAKDNTRHTVQQITAYCVSEDDNPHRFPF